MLECVKLERKKKLILQVKFSELTLDMFRMLQTLEREPQEDLNNQMYDASPAPGRTPFVSLMKTHSHLAVTIAKMA